MSRSAYYAWHQAEPSARQRADQQLKPLVRNVFREHKRRYGARRIAVELQVRGHSCSRRRVTRLMDEMELAAIQPKSFKPRTTDSRHALGYSPNLLLDQCLFSVRRHRARENRGEACTWPTER